MISVEKALRVILDCFTLLPGEQTPILEALGRVMREDIIATRNIPSSNNSAMDGYALRHTDTQKAAKDLPVKLKIIENIPAGKPPLKEVRRGEAARIMTGAVLPKGADSVVRQEDVGIHGKALLVYAPVKINENVRLAAEDIQKNECVIRRGTVLHPAHIGMLASLGKASVRVSQKPRIAIIATGDELVDIGTLPRKGQVVNSNSYALASQVLACGGIPLLLGIAKDNPTDLKKKFKAALQADVIISSGGVSVGDFDFVKTIFKKRGSMMHFWQVAMRPGKPLAFGTLQGIPLFGLPGNPVSAMVSFEQFVRPALLKMQGYTQIFRETIDAICLESIAKKAGLRYFLRGMVRKKNGQYAVTTTGNQGSGILKSMVLANGLIVLKEETTLIRKGDLVTVQLLDESLLRSTRCR